MADRTLVKNYLRDAAAAAPDDTAGQIAFLEAKRKELSPEVGSGDFAYDSAGFEGGTVSGRRGESAKARIAAIMSAMDRLEGNESGGGSLLIPQISGIHD